MSGPSRPGRADPEDGLDYSERAGFLTGKSAAIADWRHRKEAAEFNRTIATLRATKWNREHPSERRDHARAFSRSEKGVAARRRRDAKRKRARRMSFKPDTVPITCEGCEAVFCRITRPGRGNTERPRFCTDACRQRTHYRARKLTPPRTTPEAGPRDAKVKA